MTIRCWFVFPPRKKKILIIKSKHCKQGAGGVLAPHADRAVPQEGPVPYTCARVQGTGEPSAQGSLVPGLPSYRWSRAPALGPWLTRPPTPALAMPPLKKHKAEFHGLTDLGAGASRVLPQTHSQVCVRRAGRARPGLGSGWAGLGPSGQSHPGSLATRVPPAVPLKASP